MLYVTVDILYGTAEKLDVTVDIIIRNCRYTLAYCGCNIPYCD